jgi:hypothetical protein
MVNNKRKITMKTKETLTTKIMDAIPKSIRPRDYLMKKLGISKESAYRRMHHKVPLSFDEVVAISLDLGFSLDELAEKNAFAIHPDEDANAEKSFLDMLREYRDYIQSIGESKEEFLLVSMNSLNLFLLVEYDCLFRLFYYRWQRHFRNVTGRRSFSLLSIPEEVDSLQAEIKTRIRDFRQVDFIIEKDLFLSLVREIQYFYNRKLITDEEVKKMKKELLHLLGKLEGWMQGDRKASVEYNFYLSLLHVENNMICGASGERNIASLYWLYSGKILTSHNRGIGSMHKKWMEAQKKYSVLITGSNEMLQVDFIDKQRDLIENITTNSFYFSDMK